MRRLSSSNMESLIQHKLHPTESCVICTEPFSETHLPVSLLCHHIIGYQCIKKWLRHGRGNTNSCPFCRHSIFKQITNNQDTIEPAFDDASVWHSLCDQPSYRIHIFLTSLWTGISKLYTNNSHPQTPLSTKDILTKVLFPSLLEMSRNSITQNNTTPFHDCHILISASWNSLGQPAHPTGLAIPLTRLIRLMSQPSSVIPKWLTSIPRMNALFFSANACLSPSVTQISWSHIEEAAKLKDARYFPLLHLYTVIMSQTLVHLEQPNEWPERKHEVMNLVVERCCRRIGGEWEGSPGNAFKDLLMGVYLEMRRWQVELGRASLRGHEGEVNIVRGFWGMAAWGRGRTGEFGKEEI